MASYRHDTWLNFIESLQVEKSSQVWKPLRKHMELHKAKRNTSMSICVIAGMRTARGQMRALATWIASMSKESFGDGSWVS